MRVWDYLEEHHGNYSGSQDVFFCDLLTQFADGELQAKLETCDEGMRETYESDIASVRDAIAEVRNMSDEEIARLIDAQITLKLLTECEDEDE